MIDKDFIERCNNTFKDECEANDEKRRKTIRDWNENNREKLRECIRKYSKTEKGKIASKRRNSVCHPRIRELSKQLNDQELEAIRMFYVNCPPGFEVDHIIPISKGGTHHITNLQYLTKNENRTKRDKLLFIEILECPCCDNPMREIGKEVRYCDECRKAFVAYYRTEGITREYLIKCKE